MKKLETFDEKKKRRHGTIFACATVFVILVVTGFSEEQSPAFELVSIKPASNALMGPTDVEPGRVSYSHASLRFLIARANGVRDDQVNGPGWLDETLFSFDAKIPDGISSDEVPAMMQTVLADRFALKVHWESGNSKRLVVDSALKEPVER